MARPKGQPKIGGRQKGTPNKATAECRAVIATIADGMAHEFEGWIRETAIDDPAKAAELFLKAIEYHIPKLSRSEVNADISIDFGKRLDEALKRVSGG